MFSPMASFSTGFILLLVCQEWHVKNSNTGSPQMFARHMFAMSSVNDGIHKITVVKHVRTA